jgi:regulator of sigma E protease
MAIVLFILILSFLVIIHELGHFFAAKWAGVKVEEFGLGYPPKAAVLFRWLDTDFSLNWIPFGGFVRMAGEEQHSATGKKAGEFVSAPRWKRLIIILAGASVNFIFGVLAFTILFSFMGIPTPLESARIAAVAESSPAALAQLPKNGETVVKISSPAELVAFVSSHRGETITLGTTGQCDGVNCQEQFQEYSVYIRTVEETPVGEGALGVVFEQAIFVQYPLWQMPIKSTEYGVKQSLFLVDQILVALRQLVVDVFTRGSVPTDLAGPVGIVHQAQQSGIFSQGWLMIVSFMGVLSINLAIMNVLPIPPLDGGRAVFILLELILSKVQLAKLEHYINYGGYVALLGLIIMVTIRDVLRLFA